MRAYPLARVYQLIEPGPVVLLTTARKGRANVMAMSWHMMVEFEPPRIACIVSSGDYSFAALRATRECVIAIPSVEIAGAVVGVGNSHGGPGGERDKFGKFGLTAAAAKVVSAPLVAECFANLECRVLEMGFVKKYNLFILEVVRAWVDPKRKNPRTIHHRGYGAFVVDGKTIRLKSKMR